MASVGSVYLNFSLWGLSLIPAWLIIHEIGGAVGDRKVERESAGLPGLAGTSNEADVSEKGE
jgi:hypothetical protein